MKRSISAIFSGLLALSLGVSLEWALLTGSTPQAVYQASIPPTATPVLGTLPVDFQTGVVFPQWGTSAYSASNPNFTYGLKEIHDQTGARWVEIPVTLYQASFAIPHLDPSEQTATPESMAEGIRAAHARGYKVFIAPLLTVGATGWAGDISVGRNAAYTRQWFENYWLALEPYLQVAEQEHVEQFAIGTEYEALEAAPPTLWETLIARSRSVYSGTLTYDMNWTAALKPPRSWMSNPELSFLGVSVYRPLTTRPAPRDADTLPAIWRYKIRDVLDTLSIASGKPIVLSEIGYRNSSDALYQPWQWQSTAPADPALQAAAYEAALENVVNDPYIIGMFVWGWSVPAFGPNWLPAAQTLHRWYTLPRDAAQSRLAGRARQAVVPQ